jgi:hypothetical protein
MNKEAIEKEITLLQQTADLIEFVQDVKFKELRQKITEFLSNVYEYRRSNPNLFDTPGILSTVYVVISHEKPETCVGVYDTLTQAFGRFPLNHWKQNVHYETRGWDGYEKEYPDVNDEPLYHIREIKINHLMC